MNMRYICKQYIINILINMKLRKNILVLVACIATLAMSASCDKDDNGSSANIFTHRIYLDFVIPRATICSMPTRLPTTARAIRPHRTTSVTTASASCADERATARPPIS